MKKPVPYFEIAELIVKFLENELTPDESRRLNTWIAESEDHKRLWERMTDPECLDEHMQYWNSHHTVADWNRLRAEIYDVPVARKTMLRKIMRYAAVLLPLILLFGAGWYLTNRDGGKKTADKGGSATHILPQGNVARLVMGNGKVVKLNGSSQKSITEGDGTKVHNGSNILRYIPDLSQNNKQTIYNSLYTPRGGEYRVTLSDGTKVWLNAASSIRFPTRFDGKERKVHLSGEAYFEVAKDVERPFVVNTGNMDITVLGTKFNISAYDDDPDQRTTLAEGLVQVGPTDLHNENNKKVLLNPGYEAVIKKNDNDIQVARANVRAALAWKNDLFLFDNGSLGSIMRKLARWYDIDVVYDNGVDTLLHFTGRIRRNEEITGILHLLELTGKVKFSLRGRQLEVIPVWKR